jgi:hypothetical protein
MKTSSFHWACAWPRRKLNADLFISIHADAAPNRSARGSSVFALSEKASSAFAKTMAQSENSSDLIGGVKIASKDKFLAHTLLDLTQTATINDSLKLGKIMLGKVGGLNKLHSAQVNKPALPYSRHRIFRPFWWKPPSSVIRKKNNACWTATSSSRWPAPSSVA